MKGAIKAKIGGLDKAIKALEDVDKKVRGKALRKAMGAANKLVLRSMRSLVPVESGLLKKSLGQRIKVYRSNGVVVGIIGPRHGFKSVVVKTPQGAAIGGSAKSVRLLRKATKPVIVEIRNPVKYAHLANRSKNFVEAAYESQRSAAVAAMGQAIAAEILKAA